MLKSTLSSLRFRTRISPASCRSVSTIKAQAVKNATNVEQESENQEYISVPTGTRDYNDKEMTVRNSLFSTFTRIFQRHGGVTIDTPVFERRDILLGKYGEDSKLIYDLAENRGSLRYDLTVPFARYLAMHHNILYKMKRYQIGKVYRRDQPNMAKGRLREFCQCDFDIAGTYGAMIPDAEILKVTCETLDAVKIPFKIKLNHRQILDGIFASCGVPEYQIRSISSAVDKLDKKDWKEVKKEMIHEKGLEEEKADRIGAYVYQLKDKSTAELLALLEKDTVLMDHEGARKGVDDVKLLLEYLEAFKIKDAVQLDLSLARGLDYYTGIIYEAVQTEVDGVGSIAAGGRYDNLVGMYHTTQKGKKPKSIPCVGVSIGVERVFSILMARQDINQIKSNATQVYILSVGSGLLKERMELANELWEAGINASFMMKPKPKLPQQWDACEKDQIPFAIIIGEDELASNQIKIKDMRLKDKSQGGGFLLERKEMIQKLKELIQSCK